MEESSTEITKDARGAARTKLMLAGPFEEIETIADTNVVTNKNEKGRFRYYFDQESSSDRSFFSSSLLGRSANMSNLELSLVAIKKGISLFKMLHAYE
jgi:hypothetical protein